MVYNRTTLADARRHANRRQRRAARAFAAAWAFWGLVGIAFWTTVIIVAVHFIAKAW